MTGKTQSTKKPLVQTNDNILESLRGIGGNVTKSVARDVVGGVSADIIASLFGGLPPKGEVHESQPQPIAAPQKEFVRPQPVRTEDIATRQELEAIRQELKALAGSVKQFNREVEKAIEPPIVDPGVYHVNFFTRLRTIIKLLREHIEDGNSWLSVFNSRKKKMGYWGMLKKHGTTFGLSSERAIATQAG